MAGLDNLKKASSANPFVPKKINIGEPTDNPIAEPVTKAPEKKESTNEAKPKEESKPQPMVKTDKKEQNPIKEVKKPQKSSGSKVVESSANQKKSKNEGTSPFTAKFLEPTDREFFNACCTIKKMAKWEYLSYLINNDSNVKFDRNDELHMLVKNTAPTALINATTPVTPEDKEKMIIQAAMHGFKTPGAYIAYLARKERMNTPGWN